MSNFWDNLLKEADLSGGFNGSMDAHLAGKDIGGEAFQGVQGLTDVGRAAQALHLPVEAGTRVSFKANLGAVLSYSNPPEPKSEGVVVTVKSANGDVTSHDGMVFVQWDDGRFMSAHAEHLRAAKAKTARFKTNDADPNMMRVASLGDLTDFFRMSTTNSTTNSALIHKSTRDLWSFRRDGDEFLIERLFDELGEPLKG
jgi:hypothetical protein